MTKVTLGNSALEITPLVLGTDNFHNPTPESEARAILRTAIEHGLNLIDTANSYSGGDSERIIGRFLKEQGVRDRVYVATKVYYPVGPGKDDRGGSRRHIMQACEDSLRRLQTDRIDLYQLHRPDFEVPLEETLRALDDLVQAGKVRHIGCSTFPAWKIMEAWGIGERLGMVGFCTEQPPYNILDRRIENELLPCCQAKGMGVISWSPLAMGMLSGRYPMTGIRPDDSRSTLRGGIYAERVTDAAIAKSHQFVELVKAHGLDPVQTAVTWVRQQPGITAPIIGPKTVDQLKHFLPTLDMTLSAELLAAIDALVPPGSAVANFFNSADWMKMRLGPFVGR